MAMNGSGSHSRIHDWVTDKANSVKITASRMDAEFDDVSTTLSLMICRDGQSTITANLPMNSKKLTGLAAGTTAGDSVRYEQVTPTALGLVIGTDVQAWDADLDTLASTYVAGTFTPEFTFATPGDLSGVYTTQLGFYTRIGNRVFFDISMVFTPTHTTASGTAVIASLPVTSANNTGAVYSVSIGQLNNVDFGASDVQVGARIAPNATNITFLRIVDAGAASQMTTAHFPTGITYTVHISGSYPV